MSIAVTMGATTVCSLGLAPGSLLAVSQHSVLIEDMPAATIQDVSQCGQFGLCTSLANPAVASATAAAQGVLTPMPCTPVPVGPWVCGKTLLICGVPGLGSDGKLMCAYGGCISITYPGQASVQY